MPLATYLFNHAGTLPNPPWTLQDGTIMSEAGGSLTSVNFTAYNTTWWNPTGFGPAQFSELTFGNAPSGFTSLVLRANGPNNYYFCFTQGGNLHIERNVAGSHTDNTVGAMPWGAAAADKVLIAVDAAYNFSAYFNGVLKLTWTDGAAPAALAAGQPGPASYSGITGVTAWRGGDWPILNGGVMMPLSAGGV